MTQANNNGHLGHSNMQIISRNTTVSYIFTYIPVHTHTLTDIHLKIHSHMYMCVHINASTNKCFHKSQKMITEIRRKALIIHNPKWYIWDIQTRALMQIKDYIFKKEIIYITLHHLSLSWWPCLDHTVDMDKQVSLLPLGNLAKQPHYSN